MELLAAEPRRVDEVQPEPSGAPARPEGAWRFRRFVVLATAQTVLVLVLYWLVPAARQALYRENGAVEWATALLFLAATIVGVRRLREAGARWRDPRWIIPALSLLALLDEVGWVIFPGRHAAHRVAEALRWPP